MHTDLIFIDWPAYLDERRGLRCGLPAEVEHVYSMRSQGGVLEAAKIPCPSGHWFNGPVEVLNSLN